MHVVIVGAGPAGLAAAHRLRDSGTDVTIIEKDDAPGGLCKTLLRDGLRYDLGPHRFFTRSDVVQSLWEQSLGEDFLHVQRLTRILCDGRIFHYPLRAANALLGVWPVHSSRFLFSYLAARCAPANEAASFEEWVCRRFGRRLYDFFFRAYTRKVWGLEGFAISSDWAAERVRGLGLWRALTDAVLPSGRTVRSQVREFRYPRAWAPV